MQAAMRGAEDDADAAAAAALEKEEANEAAEFNAEVWHSTRTDVVVGASLAVDRLLKSIRRMVPHRRVPLRQTTATRQLQTRMRTAAGRSCPASAPTTLVQCMLLCADRSHTTLTCWAPSAGQNQLRKRSSPWSRMQRHWPKSPRMTR